MRGESGVIAVLPSSRCGGQVLLAPNETAILSPVSGMLDRFDKGKSASENTGALLTLVGVGGPCGSLASMKRVATLNDQG